MRPNSNNIENDKIKKLFCTCSKSGCKLKYCECYKNGLECTDLCRCTKCENTKIPKEGKKVKVIEDEPVKIIKDKKTGKKIKKRKIINEDGDIEEVKEVIDDEESETEYDEDGNKKPKIKKYTNKKGDIYQFEEPPEDEDEITESKKKKKELTIIPEGDISREDSIISEGNTSKFSAIKSKNIDEDDNEFILGNKNNNSNFSLKLKKGKKPNEKSDKKK